MQHILFCAGLLLTCLLGSSQSLQQLEQKLKQAKTDKDKIYVLDSIVLYYTLLYQGSQDSMAIMYSKKAITIAEQSQDRELLALAYLNHGRHLFSSYKTLKEAEPAFHRALQVAKEHNLPFYEAGAYLALTWYNINAAPPPLNTEKIFAYLHLVDGIATSLSNDSLKVEVLQHLGSTYEKQNDRVMAFRKYTQALYLAEKIDNLLLKGSMYATLSSFYIGLGAYDKGLDYYYKSFHLFKPVPNSLREYYDYLLLADTYYRAKRYDEAVANYNKAFQICNTNQWPIQLKGSTAFFLYSSYIESKNYKKAKEFYLSHPEIEEWQKSSGQEGAHLESFGLIYQNLGQLDSAEYYFRKAVSLVTEKKDTYGIQLICNMYGQFLLEQGRAKDAIVEFEKAKMAAQKGEDLVELKATYHNLDTAYALAGQMKEAYRYHRLYDQISDSLQKLSDKKELALLEVENEKRRQELLTQQEEEQLRRKHNLQYMGLTAGLAAVFIFLVLLGFFSTSTAVIRGLGFFAFIFFFEFVILIADQQIHHWTHGEPWRVLAIKVGLIAMLLPLHHYIEKRVVNYLVHHKKLQIHTGLIRRRKPIATPATPHSGTASTDNQLSKANESN